MTRVLTLVEALRPNSAGNGRTILTELLAQPPHIADFPVTNARYVWEIVLSEEEAWYTGGFDNESFLQLKEYLQRRGLSFGCRFTTALKKILLAALSEQIEIGLLEQLKPHLSDAVEPMPYEALVKMAGLLPASRDPESRYSVRSEEERSALLEALAREQSRMSKPLLRQSGGQALEAPANLIAITEAYDALEQASMAELREPPPGLVTAILVARSVATRP